MYQAIATVLEALNDANQDELCIKPKTYNDKMDIFLKHNSAVIKAIQVKTYISTFKKAALVCWISQLIEDCNHSKEYYLYPL